MADGAEALKASKAGNTVSALDVRVGACEGNAQVGGEVAVQVVGVAAVAVFDGDGGELGHAGCG